MYKSGDILSIQYPGFKHYGIFIGNDRVIHNSKKFGKVIEGSLEEFLDGRNAEFSSIKAENPEIAIQTAKKYVGLSYNLFIDNCEHFVRTVCGMEKESTQVQKYLAAALGAGVFLKSEDKIIKAMGAGISIGALLTPKEKSPFPFSLILGCLAAGIEYLATLKDNENIDEAKNCSGS